MPRAWESSLSRSPTVLSWRIPAVGSSRRRASLGSGIAVHLLGGRADTVELRHLGADEAELGEVLGRRRRLVDDRLGRLVVGRVLDAVHQAAPLHRGLGEQHGTLIAPLAL